MRRAALVEKDSKATRGFTPSKCRASRAVETAMSASWSTVGSGMTPQSAMNKTPASPMRVSSTSITMQLEAVLMSGAALMIWNNGRSRLLVMCDAPEIKPSAWCIASIIVPK